MNVRRTALALAGVLALALPGAATAADDEVELRRNPFERPAADAVEPVASEGGAKSLDNPGLRAVLVAGSGSVVNFGGVIMEVGDIQSGYELLAVREGTAVFRHQGEEVIFTLYDRHRDSER